MATALSQRPNALLAGIALASLGSVVAALVSQHVFGMEPCPWCVLMRLIFVAIALACALGLVWRAAAGRTLAALLTIVLAGCGLASALWLHFVASKSQSCNLTLADRVITTLQLDTLLADVFSPRASCADAIVDLLGLRYEWWGLAMYLLIALAAVQVLRTRSAR
jgi:disulfide bond formation protein DsbB